MNIGVGRARIGQWYTRWDNGEIFQVIGSDADSRTIDVQTFDGDLDEIDLETWAALPLALAEPPEDWTGPVDDVERDDLGYTDAEAVPPNLTQPPAPLAVEAWDDTRNGGIDLGEEEPVPAALVASERVS